MAWIVMSNENGTKSLVHSDLCDDYLAHHGIKGQKWGVRRFRNKTGTKKKHKRVSSKKSGKQRKANSKIAKRSKLYKDRGEHAWRLMQELQRIQTQMMQDLTQQQREQMMQDLTRQQQQQMMDYNSMPMLF